MFALIALGGGFIQELSIFSKSLACFCKYQLFRSAMIDLPMSQFVSFSSQDRIDVIERSAEGQVVYRDEILAKMPI